MGADDWKEIKAVLLEALGLDPPRRASYLKGAGLTPDARAEVESLLALEAEAEEFMSLPAGEFSRDLLAGREPRAARPWVGGSAVTGSSRNSAAAGWARSIWRGAPARSLSSAWPPRCSNENSTPRIFAAPSTGRRRFRRRWRTPPSPRCSAPGRTLMRQVLVDHARLYSAEKRGNHQIHFSVADVEVPAEERAGSILVLDEALCRLEKFDETRAGIVEMSLLAG